MTAPDPHHIVDAIGDWLDVLFKDARIPLTVCVSRDIADALAELYADRTLDVLPESREPHLWGVPVRVDGDLASGLCYVECDPVALHMAPTTSGNRQIVCFRMARDRVAVCLTVPA